MGIAVANHYRHLRNVSADLNQISTQIISTINDMPPSLSLYIAESVAEEGNDNLQDIQQVYVQLAVLEASVAHLNRLDELQRTSSSNEMLIFVYQFLSALLIGVGTTFVAMISKSLNDIKKEAVIVQKQYIDIGNIANEAKRNTEQWATGAIEKEIAQDIISLVSTAYNLINNCLILLSEYASSNEEARENHIVFTMQKRFNDILKRATDAIQSNPSLKLSSDDNDCINSYLTGIKESLNDVNKTNSSIFTDRYVDSKKVAINESIKSLRRNTKA